MNINEGKTMKGGRNTPPTTPRPSPSQGQNGVTNRAMRLLESLTPGGSEFYNDPERCHDFIFKQIQDLRDIAKRKSKWVIITTDKSTLPEGGRKLLYNIKEVCTDFYFDTMIGYRYKDWWYAQNGVNRCKIKLGDKWMYIPEES